MLRVGIGVKGMRGKTGHNRQKGLRRRQTQAESVLWQQLRNRRLLGMKFRRQHRIGPYSVDFACLDARLVVELDGGQHLEQGAYDSDRTCFLESMGFRVIRFWNETPFNRMGDVLNGIATAIMAPHPPSAPSPRARGEGLLTDFRASPRAPATVRLARR